MLKLVILYEDDKIYLEFSPEKFRTLLKKFFEETKDIDIAFDKIIGAIKQETLTK